MADSIVTPKELLSKLAEGGEFDFFRGALLSVLREIMEIEVEAKTGASHGERSTERLCRCNGYRDRRLDTRLRSLLLPIPKLREGSYFPGFLEPRRRSKEALLVVIAEAYVKGVSTRKVEELVVALGLEGISKSEVSRICNRLDAQVEAFRMRPLLGRCPYLWLDATYEKVRDDSGRVVSMALVVSYAHHGLKRAIKEVFLGASWQRCRVHFHRNLLALLPKDDQGMVLAAVRLILRAAGQSPGEPGAKSSRRSPGGTVAAGLGGAS